MSDAERERRAALFTPTLERLVALIRGRVRFSEQFDSWHRDERQDFKRARWAGWWWGWGGGCGVGGSCAAGVQPCVPLDGRGHRSLVHPYIRAP